MPAAELLALRPAAAVRPVAEQGLRQLVAARAQQAAVQSAAALVRAALARTLAA
ncbi:MAG: hypothetical protein ACLP6W_14545 [Bryobacteraceae bacterium]